MPIDHEASVVERQLGLVDEVERIVALAVEPIDKADDRCVAQPADLEELPVLLLDPLGGVEHPYSAPWSTFLTSAPYLLSESLHEPPSTYGLMILLPMAAYILGNAGVARLSVAVGSARLLIIGLALSLALRVMLAVWCLVALTPWALFVPVAVSSVGNGLSQPPAIAAIRRLGAASAPLPLTATPVSQ